MNDLEIDNKAKELLGKAERCVDSETAQQEAYNAITDELNKLTPDERVAIARKMQRLNWDHTSKDFEAPLLGIDAPYVAGTGQFDLVNIRIGHMRPWYDPRFWFDNAFEYVDLYNIRPDKW